MIKSLTVVNPRNERLKIVLREEEPEHGLLLMKIDGLGPVKANVNTTALAAQDGVLFNSARLPSRNIVIETKFTYAPTIEDSRQRTYKFFPVKGKVELIIETDNRLVTTTGYVESNEPDIFSELEGNQISIICPDPYFYSYGSAGLKTVVFSGIVPEFEFPFSNESLTEPLIGVSRIERAMAKDVFYEGEVEIGITMTIHALGEAEGITIFNTGTRETMTIDTDRLALLTGSGLIAGDDIIISTHRGNKYARLLRGGRYTNILNCLSRRADWFTLTQGDNIFAYSADSGANNLQFKIEYRTVYEGV